MFVTKVEMYVPLEQCTDDETVRTVPPEILSVLCVAFFRSATCVTLTLKEFLSASLISQLGTKSFFLHIIFNLDRHIVKL